MGVAPRFMTALIDRVKIKTKPFRFDLAQSTHSGPLVPATPRTMERGPSWILRSTQGGQDHAGEMLIGVET